MKLPARLLEQPPYELRSPESGPGSLDQSTARFDRQAQEVLEISLGLFFRFDEMWRRRGEERDQDVPPENLMGPDRVLPPGIDLPRAMGAESSQVLQADSSEESGWQVPARHRTQKFSRQMHSSSLPQELDMLLPH